MINDDIRPVADAARRRVLVALVALLVCPALPRMALGSTDGKEPGAADGFDDFIRLSEFLTGTVHLDRHEGRKIYDLILAEPWGREHLAQIRAKLGDAPENKPPPSARHRLLDPKRFGDGECWFIGHLLTTWFTGVYYHAVGNRSVTYVHALKFAALEDVRPVPTTCGGGRPFGFWSTPPEGAPL